MARLDSRMNIYLSEGVKDKLKEYASENGLTLSTAVNMILKNFFESQEALKNMNNLTELVKLLADKTGIDVSKELKASEKSS